MGATTEQRNIISIYIPEAFYAMIVAESEDMRMNFAAAVRVIIQWHRGIGRGRNPESPPAKLPRASKKSTTEDKHKKNMALDEEDLKYLEKIARPYGFSRQTVIQLILMDWFGLPAISPLKRKS